MKNRNWDNFRIKVVCFLLAVLIWLVLHQAIESGKGFDFAGF